MISLEIGYLRGRAVRLFSYCQVLLDESRRSCLSGILSDISGFLLRVGWAAQSNRKLGALSLTSWSAVAVCYLGQVCFPLPACLSSCVTQC